VRQCGVNFARRITVAGKSTLNRLEVSGLEPTRYHKISHNPIAIKRLLVDLFLEAHERAPSQIILDLDATDDPVHGEQEGRFFHRGPDTAPEYRVERTHSRAPSGAKEQECTVAVQRHPE
jgi:hypothetical protein